MSKYVVGVDVATGEDYTAYVVGRRPGRLRGFLRKLGVDRSTWEIKIVETWNE